MRKFICASVLACTLASGCGKHPLEVPREISREFMVAALACPTGSTLPIPGLTPPRMEGLWRIAGCGREAVVTWLPQGTAFVIDTDRTVDYSTELAEQLSYVCWSLDRKLSGVMRAWPGPGPWSARWVHPWEIESPSVHGYSRERVAQLFDQPQAGGEFAIEITVPPEQVWIRYYDLSPDTTLACLLVTDEAGVAAMYACSVNDAANTYSHSLELCRVRPMTPAPRAGDAP